jgi:hypothetical protein
MHYQCTPRDYDLLLALARCPLSTAQLLSLSVTFPQPFTGSRPLRRRLQALASAGWVRSFRYPTTSSAAENYYTLTPAGYRLLNGPKIPLPPRGSFQPVSPGLQQHTRSLADFLVHTLVSAFHADVPVLCFQRENDVRLALGSDLQIPDLAMQLRNGDQAFNFFVEIDNATEPVFTRKDRDSWQRKIRFYDRYQDACLQRFRVLVLTTRSERRHLTILHAVASLVSNPRRRLFYAAPLHRYLSEEDAIHTPCFLDHEACLHPLLPLPDQRIEKPVALRSLDLALPVW